MAKHNRLSMGKLVIQCLMLTIFGLAWVQAIGQDFRIPNKEIVIYLDNSASIVRNQENPPSEQLSSMLIELLGPNLAFLNDNDLISIQAFGTSFQPTFSRSNMVAKDDAWPSLIEEFGQPREGDSATDLGIVFRDIQQRIARAQDTDRLRIFIIASDFVQDPSNEVSSRNLGNASDVRVMVNRIWGGLSRDFLSFSGNTGEHFNASNARNFILLLRTSPYITSNSNRFYKTTTREIAQLVTNNLASDLNASVIEYTPGQLSAQAFATTIRRKLTRWLSFQVEDIYEDNNGQVGMRLQVNNPNSFPVQLERIAIALEEQADPRPVPITPVTINPGNRNSIELKNLDRVYHQANLFFFPKQSPEPEGLRQSSQAQGLNFADLDIEDLQVTYLMAHRPSLLIEAELNIRDPKATSPVSVDLMVTRNGSDNSTDQNDRFILAANHMIPITTGAGRSRVQLQLVDKNFDYGEWEQFSFTVALGDPQAPFLKKVPLRDQQHGTMKRLPGLSSFIIGFLAFILLFGISRLKTPGERSKGLRDPLIWLSLITLVIHVPFYWIMAGSLGFSVFFFLALFSGLHIALIFFRIRASQFESTLRRLAEMDPFIPEAKQWNFLRVNLFWSLFIWGIFGYIIYLFLN